MRNNVKIEKMIKEKSPLKVLRESAGLSQPELAVAIGVAVTTISRWEQQKKGTEPAMTVSEWARFCRAVGITWNDIPKYFLYSDFK